MALSSMLSFQVLYGIIKLICLMIMFWICCVDGGMMSKMMSAWMGDEKSVKAIPIPIPVLIKERPAPPPMPMMSMMQKPMKDKDWIWKMMLIKAMKSHNKGDKSKGCCSKMIVFGGKSKCNCDKGMKCPCEATPPPEPPEEEETDYYDAPPQMMGWDTNIVPVYQPPEEKVVNENNKRTDKIASQLNCKKGDFGDSFHYCERTGKL